MSMIALCGTYTVIVYLSPAPGYVPIANKGGNRNCTDALRVSLPLLYTIHLNVIFKCRQLFCCKGLCTQSAFLLFVQTTVDFCKVSCPVSSHLTNESTCWHECQSVKKSTWRPAWCCVWITAYCLFDQIYQNDKDKGIKDYIVVESWFWSSFGTVSALKSNSESHKVNLSSSE